MLVKRSKNSDVGYNPVIEVDQVAKILGPPRYDDDAHDPKAHAELFGVSSCLGWAR